MVIMTAGYFNVNILRTHVYAIRPLPMSIREDNQLHCTCIAGAVMVDNLHQILIRAGFEKIRIATIDKGQDVIDKWVPIEKARDYVRSAMIEAVKS